MTKKKNKKKWVGEGVNEHRYRCLFRNHHLRQLWNTAYELIGAPEGSLSSLHRFQCSSSWQPEKVFYLHIILVHRKMKKKWQSHILFPSPTKRTKCHGQVTHSRYKIVLCNNYKESTSNRCPHSHIRKITKL